MAKSNISFSKKVITSIVLVLLISCGIGGYFAYKAIYQSNVNLGDKRSTIIYIPTGSNFTDVVRILNENNILKDRASFEFLAEKKKYVNAIKPGKYRILAKMNNNALINLLRAGIQETVELNFNGIRTKTQLVSRLCRRIEADSVSLMYAMHSNEYLRKYGFNSDNVQALFIPNTYQFYWNTSVDEFFDRMAKEYKSFWTIARKKKARAMGFSQTDVAILASIVQAEQCCDKEEKKIIAGLYINRLKQNMLLQSDPTVIFALGDFTIQRVSHEQTQMDLPYNTYVHKGLPPGPIGFAQESSIDAVLNYNRNDFIYMCAREDMSNKHNFTKSYDQHCVNANKYREEMDKRGIH